MNKKIISLIVVLCSFFCTTKVSAEEMMLNNQEFITVGLFAPNDHGNKLLLDMNSGILQTSWFFTHYENFIYDFGINETVANIIYKLSITIFFLLLAVLLFKLAKATVSFIVNKYLKDSRNKVSNVLAKNKVYSLICYYIPLFIVYKAFFFLFPEMESLLKLLSYLYNLANVVLLCVLSFRLLSCFVDIYQQKEENKTKPIRSLVQFIQVIIMFFTVMICISIIFDIRLITMLGSLGAASAILMLVFKDSITGLIAGIQISFNNMVKLGDWIQIDKYGVEGDVIDITLTSVKVMNFDKTISTIPAYNFVASDSVQNWQGMIDFGGRRIKRTVFIDMNTVTLCTPDTIKSLQNTPLNMDGVNIQLEENGRQQTNLGIFRNYVVSYLQQHNGIIKEGATLMIRLLQPSQFGVPMELYCFTNTTAMIEYEAIQSSIFEHLFAVSSYFGLKIYQCPNGTDFQK